MHPDSKEDTGAWRQRNEEDTDHRGRQLHRDLLREMGRGEVSRHLHRDPGHEGRGMEAGGLPGVRLGLPCGRHRPCRCGEDLRGGEAPLLSGQHGPDHRVRLQGKGGGRGAVHLHEQHHRVRRERRDRQSEGDHRGHPPLPGELLRGQQGEGGGRAPGAARRRLQGRCPPPAHDLRPRLEGELPGPVHAGPEAPRLPRHTQRA